MAWEFALALAFSVVALVCGWFAVKLDENNQHLRLLFLVLSLGGLLQLLSLGVTIAESTATGDTNTLNTTYTYANFTTNASTYSAAGTLQSYTLTNAPLLVQTNQTSSLSPGSNTATNLANLTSGSYESMTIVLEVVLFFFVIALLKGIVEWGLDARNKREEERGH